MAINQSREIFLYKEIEEGIVEQVVRKIIEINNFDDENEPKFKNYKREPIKLYLETPGGYMDAGLVLVQVIKLSKTPIHAYTLSLSASMGFIIYSVCHKRFAGKYASLMYHEGMGGSFGSFTSMKEHSTRADRLMSVLDEIVLEHTKITKEKLDKIKAYKQDWYIDAEEAQKLGLVDVIL